MSIRVDEALGVHVRALDLRMQRSEILAANLANEDTPGFKARDIDFAGEMSRLNTSFSSQLSASTLSASELKYRVPTQPSQDGNSVELSVEQAEFSRNSMDFQTSLTFLSMKFRGLKQAIEGR
ncbi:flagellar basal body rod protein FlgB [Pseudomonas turukhanskensis]|uniref:Flagellar basal body rod protein FlgB n=1 Tax=Pseudomonas turukhanskensis TaxID=1806536 RepID=A0A9W6K675_9PSED|nr:flagellar basal body rod protein FlgB [Pseudomonas turukhanskensis]GLK90255.1 flagellar biosynthesis protein FlgB [Pseudomonas turukhanskensis]